MTLTKDFDYATLGFKELIAERDGGILVVTINRAKERNSFTRLFAEEFVRVFELADQDDRVHVVIFTADPTAPAYCSGAGLSGSWNGLFTEEELKEGGDHSHRDTGGFVTFAVLNCRKITIAAVNGHAAGVGLTGLQLPFDFRFIWGGAKLTFPFVRRGIVPEAISSDLLPKLVGHANARAVLLSGLTYTPTHPLLSQLYPPLTPDYPTILPERQDVLPAALAFARNLAANTSQISVAYTKSLLLHPGTTVEESHLNESHALQKVVMNGTDPTEGVKSFMQKREPAFKDRLGTVKGGWSPWWRPLEVRLRRSKL
ncbi:hypothetical protein HGRIS_003365 [Hohenbuehelia grisea]|uniref:Peroxisomal enoyl-CoA-hydratase n=1 Tax=Hohenbuehelia grisea TaxID=104357 RepID=A0ABR3JF66_9AGAR